MNQIEINKKDVDQNQQFIQDITGRESVKKERNIDISNLFINKKKQEKFQISQSICLKNMKTIIIQWIQWIRENSLRAIYFNEFKWS